MMKPHLYMLKMPFEDGPGTSWFCTHCAMIEGALLANPHWESAVIVKRIAFDRPRKDLVDLLGEEQQWLPVLVFGDKNTITSPIEITRHLALEFGGASPHP